MCLERRRQRHQGQSVLFVDDDGAQCPGALSTIQEAVTKAKRGDTVLLVVAGLSLTTGAQGPNGAGVSNANSNHGFDPITGTVVLKEGTEVELRFVEPISSKTAAIDDPVIMELADDLRVGEIIVARAGAKAFATVSNVKMPG